MRVGARQSLVLVAAIAAGCGRACSCSWEGEEPPSSATPPTASTPKPGAASPTNTAPTDEPTPAFGEGTGTAGVGAPPTQDALAKWAKPDADEKRRLESARKRLGTAKASASKTSAAALVAVFPTRVGAFVASQPAGVGKVRVGAVETAVASRSYAAGKRSAGSASQPPELYVKFTDTSAAPEVRAPVVEALTQSTMADGYYTRGAFVNGWPAVLTYSAQHRAGKAAVLVGDGFLLEARAAPIDDPQGIVTLLEALDWSDLAPREGPGK